MSFRQRTPTFRPQLSIRRVYETFQPRSEIKDLPEAYLLRVYLPGFTRDKVKITYEASSRSVRTSGERQIQGTRWYRFNQSYPIPDYCEPEALQAKFETPVLTLTMPKKATSQAPPKQEVQASQEKGVVAEPKLDEKLQDTTTKPQPTTTTKVEEPIPGKKSVSPQPTTEDTSSHIPSKPIKDQKGQEEVGPSGEPQMGEKEVEAKPTPTRVATMQRDEKIQKGQEEVESKPIPTRVATIQRDENIQKGPEEVVESKPTPTLPTKMETNEKPQKGQEEFEPRPTPTTLTKLKTAEKYQKGQEDFEPRPTPTMLTKVKTAEKSQKGQEDFEPKATSTMEPIIKTDEQPSKGQEEHEPKPAITNVTRKSTVKEQLEEQRTEETSDEDSEETSDEDSEETSDEDAEETSDEDEEKETITKNEVKEASKSRKSMKDKEQTDFEEKKTKTGKFLAKIAETSTPKVQKEKEKQSNKTSLKNELKSVENAVERAGSVSQVFTKFSEGILNEEEKKLATNIGAAVLVIAALGYYVSCRFAS